jgi:NAD(P)-dependent dehydrogenase (short-subunit alcohol dehydrogenase family)
MAARADLAPLFVAVGAHVARQLARQGAHVIIACRRLVALERRCGD